MPSGLIKENRKSILAVLVFFSGKVKLRVCGRRFSDQIEGKDISVRF